MQGSSTSNSKSPSSGAKPIVSVTADRIGAELRFLRNGRSRFLIAHRAGVPVHTLDAVELGDCKAISHNIVQSLYSAVGYQLRLEKKS